MLSLKRILRLRNGFFQSKRTCCEVFKGECSLPAEISILKNGVRLVTEPTKSYLTSVCMFISAGPLYEKECYNGVTHYVEHLAFKGFNSMKRNEFEQSIVTNGTKLWVNTYHDKIVFSAMCFPELRTKMIDIFYSIATDLAILETEMNSEKNNMVLELMDADQNAKTVLFEYLVSSAYQGTPLGQRVIGPTHNIKKFDRQFIIEWLASQFLAQNIVISAAGQVDHLEMLNKVKSTFGKMTQCDPRCIDTGARYTGSSIIYRDDTLPFAHVAIGVEAYGMNHPLYFHFKLIMHAMGRYDKSQGGRSCNGEANNQPAGLPRLASGGELCEFYKPFYITFKDTGLYGIYFVASKMNLEHMMHNIQYTWMEMCKLCLPEDVTTAIANYTFETTRSLIPIHKLAFDIGNQVLYTNTRKSVSDVRDMAKQISAGDFRGIIDDVLYDKCPVVVACGPTENLLDYNRIRASMYFIRY